MKYLSGNEEKKGLEYVNEAVKLALNSTCERAHCGSIIVKNDKVIGGGFNSPPNNIEEQRRCSLQKDVYDKKVTDKTCCVHAEQRAIIDALKHNPHDLAGSRLYFIRIDKEGKPTKAGKPYCTICSKMALDVGVEEFVLYHERGLCVYNTEEYNSLSFEYKE